MDAKQLDTISLGNILSITNLLKLISIKPVYLDREPIKAGGCQKQVKIQGMTKITTNPHRGGRHLPSGKNHV